MRLLFAHRHPLPEPRSRSIQAVQTAAAAARAGATVRFLCGGIQGGSPEPVLSYHGIDGAAIGGRLTFERFEGWGGFLFGWRAGRALGRRDGGGEPSFLVLNELTPEAALLASRAREAGLKVLLEIQSLSSHLLQRGRRVPPPAPPAGSRSFSLVGAEGKKALALVGEAGGHDDDHDHDGHDDHEHEAKPEADLPPNLDQSPAPAPPPGPEDEALRRTRDDEANRQAALLAAADGWIFRHQAIQAAAGRAVAPARPSVVLGWGASVPAPAAAAPRDLDVLYCGGADADSGVEILIAAMPTLIPHRLAIVGPMTRQDKERLRQAALSVGALERLALIDPVPPSGLVALYRRAKVGVLPIPGLTPDGGDPQAPLPLFEMMAAGLPIVASRLKAVHEYAADGAEALLVPPDDPRSLSEGLKRLLGDPALRERLAAAARGRAAGRTWEARGAGLLEFAASLTRSS